MRRVLLLDGDDAFGNRTRDAFARAAVALIVVFDETEAILRARNGSLHAVLVADRTSRSALDACDALRGSLPGVPFVAVTRTTSSEAIERHRTSSQPASAYVTADLDADALLRIILPLIPPETRAEPEAIEVSPDMIRSVRPPPPPRPRLGVVPRTDATARGVLGMRGPTANQAVALRTDSRPEPDATRVASAVVPAVKPLPPPPPPVSPSGTMAAPPDRSGPTLDASTAERRVTELEAKLAAAVHEARDANEALSAARREREEADAGWSAWVTSAEKTADEAWRERESLRASLSESEARCTVARADLERLRADVDNERRRAAALERELSAARRAAEDGLVVLQRSEEAQRDAERAREESARALADAREAHARELAALRSELARAVETATAEREALCAELGRARDDLAASDQHTAVLADCLTDAEEKIESLTRDGARSAAESSAALERRLDEARSDLEARARELSRTREEIDAAARRTGDLERERDAATARTEKQATEFEVALQAVRAERDALLSDRDRSRSERETERSRYDNDVAMLQRRLSAMDADLRAARERTGSDADQVRSRARALEQSLIVARQEAVGAREKLERDLEAQQAWTSTVESQLESERLRNRETVEKLQRELAAAREAAASARQHATAVKAAPPKPAGQDATSELVRDLALRDAELADARREQRRLQDELSRAATVRGDLDRATRQLARANSTIKHLLAAQTRLAAEQRQGTPGAPRGDEPVASLILLCERIIDAQEQRARVLETIARDGADDESIARAESLARDIEVLMAALHGCPTQPHRVA